MPPEGYPKQPAKNSVWLTNPGQYNRVTLFNYRHFTFTDKEQRKKRTKKEKAARRYFHKHKSWLYSVLFSTHKL